MKVYCIIVAYNGMKWLNKCLASLEASHQPVNIIVVDNFSGDGSAEYIKQNFPHVFVAEPGANLGFGQANNVGIRIALKEKADYFFLLNQDTWIRENTVGELLKVAKKYAGYGILSPFHLDASEQALERLFQEFLAVKYTTELITDMFLQKIQPVYETSYIHAASWLISRECIETVGGFDPLYFHYGEDDDYLQRATYFNFKIGLVPSSVIIHDCIYNSWKLMEWNKNRNMVIALQQLKKMSPNFRSNVVAFFKSGFDELTTLLLFRKMKKFSFRFSVMFNATRKIRRIHQSYKKSFSKGAFLNHG